MAQGICLIAEDCGYLGQCCFCVDVNAGKERQLPMLWKNSEPKSQTRINRDLRTVRSGQNRAGDDHARFKMRST